MRMAVNQLLDILVSGCRLVTIPGNTRKVPRKITAAMTTTAHTVHVMMLVTRQDR